MTRKYRPHQCPNCEHKIEASSQLGFKGLCSGGSRYLIYIWLEGESKRDCKHFKKIGEEK